MPLAAQLDSTDSYRRQARRLRSRHANRPNELYRSLRQLSELHDSRYRQVAPETPAGIQSHRQWAPDQAESSARMNEFACEVASRIQGTILRHSERVKLLNRAATLGIGRFDANLAIASVQNQLGQLRFVEPSTGQRENSRWSPLLMVLMIQSTVIVLVWALLLR
jgi:hypothetical protein